MLPQAKLDSIANWYLRLRALEHFEPHINNFDRLQMLRLIRRTFNIGRNPNWRETFQDFGVYKKQLRFMIASQILSVFDWVRSHNPTVTVDYPSAELLIYVFINPLTLDDGSGPGQ